MNEKKPSSWLVFCYPLLHILDSDRILQTFKKVFNLSSSLTGNLLYSDSYNTHFKIKSICYRTPETRSPLAINPCPLRGWLIRGGQPSSRTHSVSELNMVSCLVSAAIRPLPNTNEQQRLETNPVFDEALSPMNVGAALWENKENLIRRISRQQAPGLPEQQGRTEPSQDHVKATGEGVNARTQSRLASWRGPCFVVLEKEEGNP